MASVRPMDLGMKGRTALVLGRAAGIGRGIAWRSAARARGWRWPRARRDDARGGGGRDRRADGGARRRHRRPRAPGGAARPRSPSGSAGRDPRPQHRRAAAGRGARRPTRAVGGRLPRRWCSAPKHADRGGAAGDARARLGADRQRRLVLGARADPRPGALEREPDGGASASSRRSRARSPATGSRSTRSPPAGSRPSGSRTMYGSLEEAEELAPQRRSRRPARHARGVRRPRRLHLLRARRLPDRDGDPARRRPDSRSSLSSGRARRRRALAGGRARAQRDPDAAGEDHRDARAAAPG